MKKLLLILNLLALFSFLVVAGLYGLWPEHLQTLGLRGEGGKVVMLQILSFMLMLGGLQSSLEPAWRKFSLLACFLVLGQSVMMTMFGSPG